MYLYFTLHCFRGWCVQGWEMSARWITSLGWAGLGWAGLLTLTNEKYVNIPVSAPSLPSSPAQPSPAPATIPLCIIKL